MGWIARKHRSSSHPPLYFRWPVRFAATAPAIACLHDWTSFVDRMVKNNRAVVLLIVCLVFSFSELPVFAGMDERQAGDVLDAAEGFFMKLKARDFTSAWGLLTEKSRETIVKDTRKSLAKTGVRRSLQELSADFDRGGPVSTFY
jgi:hypothetical protein